MKKQNIYYNRRIRREYNIIDIRYRRLDYIRLDQKENKQWNRIIIDQKEDKEDERIIEKIKNK